MAQSKKKILFQPPLIQLFPPFRWRERVERFLGLKYKLLGKYEEVIIGSQFQNPKYLFPIAILNFWLGDQFLFALVTDWSRISGVIRMGFFKKLAGVFGFGQEVVKNEDDDTGIDSGNGDKLREDNQPRFRETGLPRKGFGVPVQVAVERSQLGPLLQPCAAGDGGIQGLRWYTKRLRVDEDGDIADEFLEEKLTNTEDDHNYNKTMPRLEAKRKTKPAKVRGLVVSSDGKLQQCIEHQGRLLIV